VTAAGARLPAQITQRQLKHQSPAMATRAAELRVAIRELNDRCLYASVKWCGAFSARGEKLN
jgi:hypothetical protein